MGGATGTGVAGEGLARRIAERREQLGLSREEVAARAGLEPDYLEYLEKRAGAIVTARAMLRLAAALETTLSRLGDADAHLAAGIAEPLAGRPELVELPRAECLDRLHAGEVGRVVFSAARGPVAYPVNYAVVGGDVVFSASPSTAGDIAAAGEAGFEIDHVDLERHEGWSVLVTGRARLGSPPPAAPAHGGAPAAVPWAGGGHDTIVRIAVGEITGRVLRRVAGAPQEPHGPTA